MLCCVCGVSLLEKRDGLGGSSAGTLGIMDGEISSDEVSDIVR